MTSPAENITNPAPAPLATAVIVTDGGNTTVPCEPINEFLAITPVFGMTAEGKTVYDGGFTITHLPTGTQIVEGPGCIECCRYAGRGLDALPIDWPALTADNSREWSAALSDDMKLQFVELRAVEWRCDADLCDYGQEDRG